MYGDIRQYRLATLDTRTPHVSHLFVSLEHQSKGCYLLSLGAEQRLELQDLLHAALLVLVQERGQFPGCCSLPRQLQRPVDRSLEVLHLEEWRGEVGKIGGEVIAGDSLHFECFKGKERRKDVVKAKAEILFAGREVGRGEQEERRGAIIQN